MKIAVVGAGLGGVAAAVGLHRAGHEVTLYERAPELREAGTAIVIPPNGVRALDALGLSDYVRSQELLAPAGGLRDRRGRPLLVTDVSAATAQVGTSASVGRRELHRSLREPLPAELVRTGTPITRLEEVGDADAVIAADGIGSALRALLYPQHPGTRRVGRLDLRGMLPRPAGLDVTELLSGMLVDHRTGAMFGLFPVGADQLYWFTDSKLGPVVPSPGQARKELLELMADWHPTVPALLAATRDEDVYVDPIACLAEPVPSFAVGNVALLGDAAHAMTPDLGQGASQAFEDAVAITRLLADATPGDVPDRLRRYDAERRPPTTRLMRASLRQGRLTSQTGFPAWLRDQLLRAIPNRLATRRLASMWQIS